MRSVTPYTGAVFNNGAVRRILDLAVASHAEGGPPLDDELVRFCRTVRDAPAAEWAMPLATVSALLDLIGEQIDEPVSAPRPVGFDQRLAEAAGQSTIPAFLSFLAGFLRAHDTKPLPDFEQLPMARWEAQVRFPKIMEFAWWVESGELDPADSLCAGAVSEHPHRCRSHTAYLAAELQQALLVLPASPAAAAGFTSAVPWATKPLLRAMLDAIEQHFDEEHRD